MLSLIVAATMPSYALKRELSSYSWMKSTVEHVSSL